MFKYGWVTYCIGLRIRKHEEVFDKKLTCDIGICQNLLEVFENKNWQGLDLYESELDLAALCIHQREAWWDAKVKMAEVGVAEGKDYQGMCDAVVIKVELSNLSDILEIWKSNSFLYQLIKKGEIRKILNNGWIQNTVSLSVVVLI